MKRMLILYDSLTGATEKMALEVEAGAKETGLVEVRRVHLRDAKVDDVLWADGVALGSPTNMGLLSWRMKKFWDEDMQPYWGKIDGKLGAVFSSQGGWAGGGEIACQSMLTMLINFGFLVFGVTDYVSKTMTLHYGALSAKEPRDPETRAASQRLGQKFAHTLAHLLAPRQP